MEAVEQNSQPEEKECAACGAFFQPSSPRAMYCDACRPYGYRLKKRIEQRISIAISLDKNLGGPFEHTCEECGNTFLSGYKELRNSICSSACRKINKEKSIICDFCRKRIMDVREITDQDLKSRTHFCNDECDRKWHEKRNVEKYGIRTCPICGTEFSKDATFCGKECYGKWIAKNKSHPAPAGIPAKERTSKCPRCGKEFQNPKRKKFCSRGCYDEWIGEQKSKRQEKDLAAREEKRQKMLSKQDARQKKARASRLEKETEYIAANGMCGICRTPYMDCERMQTEFRVLPKGAKYDSKGHIAECPKFS